MKIAWKMRNNLWIYFYVHDAVDFILPKELKMAIIIQNETEQKNFALWY